jgi:ATP diphosphatase
MSVALEQLLAIMARLRDPERGCPWDIEQNFDTIAPYTVEEAHEVADAIARRDYRNLQEELGDLLLQVVFHAQMAQDQGLFAFEAVAEGINAKLIRRHPHVFPGGQLDGQRDAISTAQVSDSWDAIKAAEKAARGETAAHLLDAVSAGMPALARAEKLQKKASKVGFDWHDPKAVLAKLREEIDEVEEAIDRQHPRAAQEDELGDILFCVVNLARHLDLDAEQALKRSNAKFIRRFNHIEDTLKDRGQAFAGTTLETMEQLWVEAKAVEPKLA